MAMLDWYQATCDCVPRSYDMRMAPEMLWAKVESRCDPAWADEIREMINGGAGIALVNSKIETLRKR